MSSSRAGEVAVRSGSSPKCKWIFSKEEMLNVASVRSGLNEDRELKFRQQAMKFIQLLGDRLNANLRDNRGKITQLCMCAAMIHMHRFFYFHSFTFFDFRDVAAACLFLSGKSEECPRKIDHIVRAWWSEKFPGIKLDQQKYEDAMGLLVAIESIILQTIAFDLQVALPHPLVLKAMHTIAKNNRKITEVVYFFSTDVLCVTSWGIRYSAEAIAVACVYIVCTWASFEMPPPENGMKWYHKMDPTMSEEQLQEMMREFITVYRSCKNDLAITKFIKKGEIRDPISSDGEADRVTPPAYKEDDLACLPPPPPPPLSLASKKVDINAYKERRATESGHHGHSGSSSGSSSSQPRRNNFMPEMNTITGASASMAAFVPPKQEQMDRKPDYMRDDYRSSSSSSQQQRPPRPPSNGSSSGQQQHQHRSSHYMQQQPSGSGSADNRSMDRSMGDRSREDRERSDKRKREMSCTNLQSDKRSRMDMPMAGSGGQSQRSHSSSQHHQPQQQQPQHNYNSVPPPHMQQQPHYGSSSKQQLHFNGQPPPTIPLLLQNMRPQSGYHPSSQPFLGFPPLLQNGYGMPGAPPAPPPHPPLPAATGNDMEDGEVF